MNEVKKEFTDPSSNRSHTVVKCKGSYHPTEKSLDAICETIAVFLRKMFKSSRYNPPSVDE